jgi:hypothetical protein
MGKKENNNNIMPIMMSGMSALKAGKYVPPVATCVTHHCITR